MNVSEGTPVRVSDAELARRWTAIRREMAERSIDALIIRDTNDWLGGYVRWFTDVPANSGYPRAVIFHRDDLMTVVDVGPFDGRQAFQGKDEYHRGVGERLTTPTFASIAYTLDYDATLIATALRRRAYGTVGFVAPRAQPQGFFTTISQSLAGKTAFVDATEVVDAIKTVKSAEEIALIRATAAMQDAVFGKVLEIIRPGMRDIDVIAAAWAEGQLRGSEQGIILGASAPLGQPSRFVGRNQQGRQ